MSAMRAFTSTMLLCAALLCGIPAWARTLNILITNDDGFESANIRATYTALKAAGFHVIMSASTQDQSGKGAGLDFAPLGPLKMPTRYGTVAAGAPGIGVDPHNSDIHYVDGTAVMSTLYGAEVAASAAFGGQPDLILSGPNEGSNLGALVLPISGTESNAYFGASLGIPSIAISSGDHAIRSYWSLSGDSDPAARLALVVVRLVKQLRDAAHGSPVLPAHVGLNVNVPQFTTSCTPSRFTLTRFRQGAAALVFSPDPRAT